MIIPILNLINTIFQFIHTQKKKPHLFDIVYSIVVETGELWNYPNLVIVYGLLNCCGTLGIGWEQILFSCDFFLHSSY